MEATTDRWAVQGARIAIVIMAIVVAVVVVLNADLAADHAQQITNTNMSAPFSALGFLAGAAAFVVGIAVIVGAYLRGHKTIARAMATVAAVEVVLYASLLVGYSTRSKEMVLSPGQEKFFCEIDCHIAYTIADVKREGEMLRVGLRTRFDEHSIAPWRGNGTLSPNPRVIELVDSNGRVYPGHQSSGPQLTTPLRPGESYVSEFVFSVPPDVREPRLLVLSEGVFPDRVLIGNENSFLHQKIWFRL